jgi:acyl-CoA synthetase (AMP-forming)/AMP-acid ligase II
MHLFIGQEATAVGSAALRPDDYIFNTDRGHVHRLAMDCGARRLRCQAQREIRAAVVTVPDKKWGESVKAFVVLKEGVEACEEELIDFCKEHLASYKKPRSVEFRNVLPNIGSGKIKKAEIREIY